MRYLTLAVLAAIALPLAACDSGTDPPTPRVEVAPGPVHMDVIGLSPGGDSVDVRIVFDTVASSDLNGIAQIDWQVWGTSDPAIADTVSGSTTTLEDTVRVRDPAEGTTDGYAIRARAVDGLGNVGAYGAAQSWALRAPDVTGPAPPQIIDPAPGDTLIAPTVILSAVWPEAGTVGREIVPAGQKVQFYRAVLLADATVHCEEPPADPEAWYSPSHFPYGCDSARARLQRLAGG